MSIARGCVVCLIVVWALAIAAPAVAQDPQPDHPMPTEEQPRLRLSGFADVNFAHHTRATGPRGFSVGQFVLHLMSHLSSRVTFLGEISFSARTDAGTGTPPAPGFNAEIERAILRFDQSDRLRLSIGRYHTPINYWNTAFHHGQWLQTTISRPEMIQFGGRLLPVHFIGALVEGVVPAGGWNVGYKAGLGNGRATVISRGGDAGDSNNDLAWVAGLQSKPDALYGLEVGASFYVDTVTPAAGDNVREHIVSGYVAYLKETPELIAEYALVRHRESGGDTHRSHAYYGQAAYRFPFDARKWKGYVRFEHIDVAAGDAVLTGVQELDSTTVGLRYDVTLYAAVKAEFRTWTRGAGTPRNQGGYFQVAFTF